jgi:hypothetical protein
MAIRRRTVLPDEVLDTQTYGPIPVVSDAAWVEALVAAAQAQSLYGGVLTTVVDRHPTDLPQEMVTTRGIIELKDRTDARPQPESQTGARYSAEDMVGPGDVEHLEALQREINEERMAEREEDEPSGLEEAPAAHDDLAPVEGEDTESIPEPVR